MTATLEFRGLDLLTAPAGHGEGRRIQIVSGFLMPPGVRGEDYIVAAKAGRSSGTRIADVNAIVLAGYIAAASVPAWRLITDQWLAVLDEAGATPGALIARNGYLGLGAGITASINARVKNIMPGPIVAGLFQKWSVELESTDPDWVLA